jgi:hypothetical protein
LVDWSDETRTDHFLVERLHVNYLLASLASGRPRYFCSSGQFEGAGVPVKRSAIQRSIV